MSDAFEQQEWVKFGVAAALARQYAQDQRGFFDLLGKTLESALPEATELKYAGGFFSKKSLQRVSLTLGEDRYAMEDAGHGLLQATHTRVVRGIALKTEELPVEEWVRLVGEAVDARAAANASAREALAKFLG